MSARPFTNADCAALADVCWCDMSIARDVVAGEFPRDELFGDAEQLPDWYVRAGDRVVVVLRLFGWFDRVIASWCPSESVH